MDGYAAPQLHTHAVIFNVAERDNGQTRALQPHEIFVSQRYVTAVYRSELALRLEGLGYQLERGKHGQPEIKRYTKDYLEASSPRREQVDEWKFDRGEERGNIYRGLAKPDDPAFKEGWSITLPQSGRRSSIPSNNTSNEADDKADAPECATRDEDSGEETEPSTA